MTTLPKKLRIVFMGTPEFAVPSLVAIHANHSVVGVYTQPDRPVGRGLSVRFSAVKTKAVELGLSTFQPERLSLPGEFEKLQDLSPDLIVVVAYGQILRRPVLELPRLGCVNIHSSLLPSWRGAAPIQWAILAGEERTGVSTMHLVEKLDAGDVLLQKSTPIEEDDTAQSLHDRLSHLGAELILPTIQGLADNQLQRQPQEEAKVTYASKLSKEMEWLDPSESAATLDRRIRALFPWPGTSVNIAKQRLKIKRAKARRDIQGPAGQIFERAGMILMGTASGSLELQLLQWEGKKEVDPMGFLNGLKGKGQTLPLQCDQKSQI